MPYTIGCRAQNGNTYECKTCAYNADPSGCKTSRNELKAVPVTSMEHSTIDERFDDERDDIVDDRIKEQRRW